MCLQFPRTVRATSREPPLGNEGKHVPSLLQHVGQRPLATDVGENPQLNLRVVAGKEDVPCGGG